MKILIEIRGSGTCAVLNAWTDNANDEPYLLTEYGHKHEVRAVELWHNDFCANLRSSHRDHQVHNLGFNITLESKVDFKTFCDRLAASGYSDQTKWRHLRHNCAMAVAHALKLAEIDINIPSYKILNRTGAYATDVSPFFTLSPLDLLDYLIAFKVKELNSENVSFKLELAHTALNFWNRKNPQLEQRELITTINNELPAVAAKHPEHADLALDYLMQTADFILQRPHVQATNDFREPFYGKSARFFRAKKHSETGSDGIATIVNISVALGVLLYAFKAMKVSPKVSKLAAHIGFSAVAGCAVACYRRYYNYWYGAGNRDMYPTKLSDAMERLQRSEDMKKSVKRY